MEYGDYGNTSGNSTEYAVEPDSSIDGYGLGAETASPCLVNPANMLKEMEKFPQIPRTKLSGHK